jgi:hypothetical protein
MINRQNITRFIYMTELGGNPLLHGGRIPGASFALPSQGLFYNDGELEDDVKNGEVHVFPMTAYDEILIKTPDLLLSGVAVTTVIKRCVPQVLKPERLLSRDLDYLMTALRSVSFGNEVEIVSTHTCEGAKEHNYIINIGNFTRIAKNIDPTTKNQQYLVELPDKKVVHFTPIRYDGLMELLSSDYDHDDTDSDAINNVEYNSKVQNEHLAGMIYKVVVPALTIGNSEVIEITEKHYIAEWLSTVPVSYVRAINAKIDAVSEYGADLTYTVKCLDCTQDMVVSVPLNPIRFFTLP